MDILPVKQKKLSYKTKPFAGALRPVGKLIPVLLGSSRQNIPAVMVTA